MNYKEKLAKLGVLIPNVLLPNKNIDYSKYAVLACDQYAAQPEYWRRGKEYVGDSPSALNLILPEAWLLEGDRNYEKRAGFMKKYLSDGTLEDMGEAMIFNRRKTPSGVFLRLKIIASPISSRVPSERYFFIKPARLS